VGHRNISLYDTIRMEKLIDIIMNKNINLHGLHFYFSTVDGLI
jgi:hypothetical protein